MIDNSVTYPRCTKEMKQTHTILIPQMAPLHFYMLAKVFEQEGYRTQLLENDGPK